MKNVLLVEDSKITRDMVESILAKSDAYLLVASLENAANAEIACMKGEYRPDSDGCLHRG